MARAVQLTAHYSKPQILAMYLTLAPYGGNIEGVRAASLAYFQKPPDNSPMQRRPCWSPCRAARNACVRTATRRPPCKRRAMCWRRTGWTRILHATDLAPPTRHPMPSLAPQLSWRLYGTGARGIVRTTLDAGLQQNAAALLNRALPWLPAKEGARRAGSG